MAELIWDGKYDEHGHKRAPVRIELPFQTVETVNESAQERQRTLELSASGHDSEWRNRLIWGDKKYVLPSLLPEFAGKVDLIYIDPPFFTGTDQQIVIRVSEHLFLEKEPSLYEEAAYRNVWRHGWDSFFHWTYDTLFALREGRLQTIHTKASGEITNEKELQKARETVKNVDRTDNPINAIVSVLMLREGWDVQNVTVVVGLRPYSAKAEILPEQAIGRGLRLMFRDLNADYTEHVDIIGTPKFLEFVDDLEKIEDMRFDTVELGKEKLRILTIMPIEERKVFDIALPVLTPTLVRKKSLADEIASLDVMSFNTILLPLTADDPNTKTFRYEGHDIITLQKIVERDYKVPEPQTAQEIIGYYARIIAKAVKLPSQFAVLAPKVREFFENKAFGRWVDLEKHEAVRAMATPVASYVCTEEFKRVLGKLSIAEQEPQLVGPPRMLSSCQPFPWSRKVLEANKTVFNMTPCDNDFERAFARLLDDAGDVTAFAKLPQPFGFSIDYVDAGMNLRSYYPDFVAVDADGVHWLIETKGAETAEVAHKDLAARNWCDNAARLTSAAWRYIKVPQKAFEVLQPSRLEHLSALQATLPGSVGAI